MAATKTTHSPRKARRDWRPLFLQALAEEGTVFTACINAGIARSTAYRERQSNEDFAVAWSEIELVVTERLERKAVAMALAGEVPVLLFLLKARKPDVYRESVNVRHSGRIEHDLTAKTEDELVAIADELGDKRSA